MAVRETILETLREIGSREDRAIELAETALLLAAADREAVSLDAYRQHLADITERAKRATARTHSVDMQVTALVNLLVRDYDYRGDADTYDDIRNANLMDVIDRRRGLPVALGILWLHAGRAYDASLVGLSFPSHFVIRLEARGQRVILDPFNAGRQLGAEDLRRMLKEFHGPDQEIQRHHYLPVDDRDILIRLQNNIKLRAVAENDLGRALDVLETMRLIAPNRSELWGETAILQSRLGNLKMAIATLEGFLEQPASGDGHSEIEDLLRRLRNRIN